MMNIVEIAGGVGGARMARGFSALVGAHLTVVVNVGDDDRIHGLHVSPDIDTVIYTLAGVEGAEGWGRHQDTFKVNDELGRLGVDNRFRLGDSDLALNIYRTWRLGEGERLSEVTRELTAAFGLDTVIIPATDDRLRTLVRLDDGWTSFQDYFVIRGNRDEVLDVEYEGSSESTPAPGVIDAIRAADILVIAPSNPPLSVWPVLAVPGIREAVASHHKVVAVSPLIGGRALKGPADRVMRSLGLAEGNSGVADAYRGLIDTLIIDRSDLGQTQSVIDEVSVVALDTLIGDPEAARRLAEEIVRL